MEQVSCILCDQASATSELFGYPLCSPCKSKIGLFTDAKIQEHAEKFEQSGRSYTAEVQAKLKKMQRSYIKGEIKLLHILERLKSLDLS